MKQGQFDGKKLERKDREWREALSEEQYEVLRKKGTEPAFHNEYYANPHHGTYVCAGCALPLYRSEVKYDSGTGWPSFWEPIYPENVSFSTDKRGGSSRIEVICSRCGGHLGHVFDDGPAPTGKRYCMNSAALRFIPSP